MASHLRSLYGLKPDKNYAPIPSSEGKSDGRLMAEAIKSHEDAYMTHLTRQPYSDEVKAIRKVINERLAVYQMSNRIRCHEARYKSRVVIFTADIGCSGHACNIR